MTEAEWLTDTGGRQLTIIEQHATVRKLRLIAAVFVRLAQLEPANRGRFDTSPILCDDLIEAAADTPISWDEVEPVLRTRPGESWRFTHILAHPGLQNTAKELRRLLAMFSTSQPHFLRDIIHEVIGNPFRPVTFSPEWRTDTAMSLARGMYDSREFSAMPILADALQDAGCDSDDILTHCRDAKQVHVRGCWVVDGVLGEN